MLFFNTAGPCEPDRHYMIPAAARLPQARDLFDKGAYFVLHAPRQTGKTTTLRALAEEVTQEGRFTALYFSCKPAETAGGDVVEAQRAIIAQLRRRAALNLPRELCPPEPWPDAPVLGLLAAGLAAWAQVSPRPLVLFFDEIDALYGDALRAVLAQLHAAYPERPRAAPWSVVLCGLRDIKDYRTAAGKHPERFGSASPFNIKLESIRLGDFSRDEVDALYAQHTAATGQPFTVEAVERAFALSCGQPWLVNALAREILEEMRVRPPAPITSEHMDQARERLIFSRSRATHLDSLLARLHEDRVKRVLEPILAGLPMASDSYQDDIEYVRDLGILAKDRPVRIANPIYHEVVARVLSDSVDAPVDERSFVGADGRLELRRLFESFAEYWQENGEMLAGNLKYHEVAPQLVLMSYLQGVVNGKGHINREYGLGRGRIDLLLRWSYPREDGSPGWQKEAVELKVWQDKKADPLPKALDQLEKYLDRCGLDHGVLVIFDRRTGAPPVEERTVLSEARTAKGQGVLLLRG